MSTTRTLDQLCGDHCISISRILPFIDDVDQSDEEAVRVAVRAGIAASNFRDLACYADLFAAALADERTAAVIENIALPGAKVRSRHYDYGTVLCSYRNAGSLGGWIYRAQFGFTKRAVSARDVTWVGGIRASREQGRGGELADLPMAAE